RGLGISRASLRKKLQVLNLSDAAQEQIDTIGLTEAGIRAFMRLAVTRQEQLLVALNADPSLARGVKTIIQDVTKRGYPLEHALALARGEVWMGTADDSADVQDDNSWATDLEEDSDELLTAADRPAPSSRNQPAAAPKLTADDAARAAALSKA